MPGLFSKERGTLLPAWVVGLGFVILIALAITVGARLGNVPGNVLATRKPIPTAILLTFNDHAGDQAGPGHKMGAAHPMNPCQGTESKTHHWQPQAAGTYTDASFPAPWLANRYNRPGKEIIPLGRLASSGY